MTWQKAEEYLIKGNPSSLSLDSARDLLAVAVDALGAADPFAMLWLYTGAAPLAPLMPLGGVLGSCCMFFLLSALCNSLPRWQKEDSLWMGAD